MRNPLGKCPYYAVLRSMRLRLPLDGMRISFTDNIKYLGVSFNKLIKFNIHARLMTVKAQKVRSYVLATFSESQPKLLIYKVSIMSV